MGSGLVVGFPSNLRTVYVDQLETIQTAGSILSLTDSVMAADKEVATWWRHHRLLQVVHKFKIQTDIEFWGPDSNFLAFACNTLQSKQTTQVFNFKSTILQVPLPRLTPYAYLPNPHDIVRSPESSRLPISLTRVLVQPRQCTESHSALVALKCLLVVTS